MSAPRQDEREEGALHRGAPAEVLPNGEVVGSGAGAGGGGTAEDIDGDSAGGRSSGEMPAEGKRPDTGADASNHGSR